MNKNQKRGYDILASHIQDTFVNLLRVTNAKIVEPDTVAFQLGRLNQVTTLLDDIEGNTGKHVQVIVSVDIKEKSNGR